MVVGSVELEPLTDGVGVRAEAFLIADAAVHPALLVHPDWPYASDHDGAAAAGTRREVVAELADTDELVVCGHYPGSGIGRLVTEDGRVVWREASAS